jgi:hypothetical protein
MEGAEEHASSRKWQALLAKKQARRWSVISSQRREEMSALCPF